jgi:hypothetical protein
MKNLTQDRQCPGSYSDQMLSNYKFTALLLYQPAWFGTVGNYKCARIFLTIDEEPVIKQKPANIPAD